MMAPTVGSSVDCLRAGAGARFSTSEVDWHRADRRLCRRLGSKASRLGLGNWRTRRPCARAEQAGLVGMGRIERKVREAIVAFSWARDADLGWRSCGSVT